MSLATSRNESAAVVLNAFNLFIDSERSTQHGHGQSKGDSVHLHLEGQSVEAREGEQIRLSLTNFTMFNNMHHVDATNRRLQLHCTGGGGPGSTSATLLLTRQNHAHLHSLAVDFANVLATQLASDATTLGAAAGAFVIVGGEPAVQPVATGLHASDTRLLDFTLEYQVAGVAANHQLTGVVVQTDADSGEAYQLLGSRRVDVADTVTQSLKITLGAQDVRVQGLFPMQRSSDPYVYLRCGNVSNGLEMSVLGGGTAGPDVQNSNILAKIFRDVEYCSFQASTGMDYFLNLQTRTLSHLHLFLTDSKGRNIGRLPADASNTAAGLTGAAGGDSFEDDQQGTLGNLFFTCVLKVELLQMRNAKHLQTTPIPAPLPAREAQMGVVVWPDYGRPKL